MSGWTTERTIRWESAFKTTCAEGQHKPVKSSQGPPAAYCSTCGAAAYKVNTIVRVKGEQQ